MNADSGSCADDDEIDPRRLRSRARLLDAATGLLSTGGIEAVTIDAVTKASKVARTTLYRHFSSSTHLLAATFERLLPQVTPPPESGTLRQRLIELLSRQAVLIEETPIQLTTLAWLALGSTASGSKSGGPHEDGSRSMGALRARVADQYRWAVRSDTRQPPSSCRTRRIRHHSCLVATGRADSVRTPDRYSHLRSVRLCSPGR